MEAFLAGTKSGLVRSKENDLDNSEKMHVPRHKGPIPWVEKYRPKTVDEVAYQEEVVAVLKKTLQGSDLPNLLFYGPPGTGKTSTILALARELFGDMYRSRILELNASDERGIEVVREKVKNFARQTASGTRPDGTPCPVFKIVILDEADSMTPSAQAALRRTMETETKTTRFCLICNYISRIIEPLTSRCSKFRFKPLTKEITMDRLRHISQLEDVRVEDGVLESLVDVCEGDLRKAITLLQSAFRLKGDEAITLSDIHEIACVIPDKWIKGLLEVCRLNSYDKLEQHITDMLAEGFTAGQLMNQLHDAVVFSDNYTDKQKSSVCERLAIDEHRLMDGADEYLQSLDVCIELMNQMSSNS